MEPETLSFPLKIRDTDTKIQKIEKNQTIKISPHRTEEYEFFLFPFMGYKGYKMENFHIIKRRQHIGKDILALRENYKESKLRKGSYY